MKGRQGGKIDTEKSISVQDQRCLRLCKRTGLPDRPAGAQWLLLQGYAVADGAVCPAAAIRATAPRTKVSGAEGTIRAGRKSLRKKLFKKIAFITQREDKMPDPRLPEIIGHITDKRSPAHRGHTLGQFRDSIPQPGSQASCKYDSFFNDHALKYSSSTSWQII